MKDKRILFIGMGHTGDDATHTANRLDGAKSIIRTEPQPEAAYWARIKRSAYTDEQLGSVEAAHFETFVIDVIEQEDGTFEVYLGKGSFEQFMNGDLDPLIDALVAAERQQLLQ